MTEPESGAKAINFNSGAGVGEAVTLGDGVRVGWGVPAVAVGATPAALSGGSQTGQAV